MEKKKGRPKQFKDRVSLTVWLDPADLERLQKFAKAHEWPVSRAAAILIRKAVIN